MSLRRAMSAALGAAALVVLGSATAAADSFTPVTMQIAATPIGRLAAPYPVKVTVRADPGVLDTADGPLRVGVKLATECGGSFETTDGVTLLHAALSPAPTVGRAYVGTVRGAGRPAAYGTRTLCTYLEDSGSDRVYANDESMTTDVTAACTTAGRTYDRRAAALRRARRALRHARTRAARARDRRTVRARSRALAAARRRGVAACGPGVTL